MKTYITLANERADILDVCRLIEMPEVDYSYSGKLYCPFGDLNHADGGATKAFRIYPASNSAYCFACISKYTPVSLFATYKDLSYEDAAEILIETLDITRETVDDRWNDLTKRKKLEVNTADLAESLRIYCKRICPDWETKQFEPEIALVFDKCLKLIGLVKTEEDATTWQKTTKLVMEKRLT